MNRNVAGLRRALRLLFGDRLLPVRAESGRWLWYRPAEYPSLLRGLGRFEPEQIPRWRALLRPDDVIYDVGANIGITAHRFYGLLRGRCRILAFEPVPRNADLLELNARALGANTVTVLRCAVGEREGTMRLRENVHHGALSARAEISVADRDQEFWTETAEFDVAMRSLDGVVRDGAPPPDFVKVDVEGAGNFVMQGARDLLRTARPVWSISLHIESETKGVRAALGEAGYRGVRFDADGASHFCELDDRDAEAYVHPESPKAERVGSHSAPAASPRP